MPLGLATSGQATAAPVAVAARACADAAPSAWFRVDLRNPRVSKRLFAGAVSRNWQFSEPSPDGRWFVYDTSAGLGVASVDGRTNRLVTQNRAVAATWSPDQRKLAFDLTSDMSNTIDSLSVVNVDGGGLHQATTAVPYDAPSWSPDSRLLSFLVGGGGKSTLVVARADGSQTRMLVPAAGSRAWSPRGQWIAYEGRDSHIHLIHPDGSGGRVVAFGGGPSWAPDGSRFVFVKGSSKLTFGIASLRGKLLRSFGTADAGPPFWSPRGDQIAYPEPVKGSGRDQLFTVRPDGTHARQLTHDRPASYDDPIVQVVWVSKGPNKGRQLFYSRALCDSSP